MIIRNFLESEYSIVPSHDGKGFVQDATIFHNEDFSTGLRFMIYTQIEPGASIGYHQHGENEEVYIILEGKGVMTVNGQSKEVKTGDIILNKPGWSHGLENNSNNVLKVFVFEVDK